MHKVGAAEWQQYHDLLLNIKEDNAAEVHEELVRMGIKAGAGTSGDVAMEHAGKQARVEEGSAISMRSGLDADAQVASASAQLMIVKRIPLNGIPFPFVSIKAYWPASVNCRQC